MLEDLMSIEYAIKYLNKSGFKFPEKAIQAHKWCLEQAERGDIAAQCVISTLYWTGISNQHDSIKAIEWCEKAANAGSNDAKCVFAGHLISGINELRDIDRGVALLRDLINAGHIPSMLSLAMIMLSGEYDAVPLNRSEAVELLLEPAQAGSVTGQCLLGMELIKSEDVGTRKAGAKWIEQAAGTGSSVANRYLSNFYRTGDYGFPIDQKKANFHAALAKKLEEKFL